MPFGPTGGRANTVLETMNSVNADIAVEMIAIRRRRFILSSSARVNEFETSGHGV